MGSLTNDEFTDELVGWRVCGEMGGWVSGRMYLGRCWISGRME